MTYFLIDIFDLKTEFSADEIQGVEFRPSDSTLRLYPHYGTLPIQSLYSPSVSYRYCEPEDHGYEGCCEWEHIPAEQVLAEWRLPAPPGKIKIIRIVQEAG